MPEQNPRHRRSYLTSLIGAVFVLALGFGGYYLWQNSADGFGLGRSEAPAPAPVQEVQPPVDTRATYASSTMRVSAKYPGDFTLREDYAYTGVSKTKPISGVQFVIPAEMATGTNLAADSYIAIEQLPRANACTGDIYLAANVRPVSFTEGANTYSLASSTQSTAGGSYEEMVYALASSTPCTAVRYFIHTTTIESAASSTVREFDRTSLLAAFDQIRQSLVMQ